jgi:hypothetical protein
MCGELIETFPERRAGKVLHNSFAFPLP